MWKRFKQGNTSKIYPNSCIYDLHASYTPLPKSNYLSYTIRRLPNTNPLVLVLQIPMCPQVATPHVALEVLGPCCPTAKSPQLARRLLIHNLLICASLEILARP